MVFGIGDKRAKILHEYVDIGIYKERIIECQNIQNNWKQKKRRPEMVEKWRKFKCSRIAAKFGKGGTKIGFAIFPDVEKTEPNQKKRYEHQRSMLEALLQSMRDRGGSPKPQETRSIDPSYVNNLKELKDLIYHIVLIGTNQCSIEDGIKIAHKYGYNTIYELSELYKDFPELVWRLWLDDIRKWEAFKHKK